MRSRQKIFINFAKTQTKVTKSTGDEGGKGGEGGEGGVGGEGDEGDRGDEGEKGTKETEGTKGTENIFCFSNVDVTWAGINISHMFTFLELPLGAEPILVCVKLCLCRFNFASVNNSTCSLIFVGANVCQFVSLS